MGAGTGSGQGVEPVITLNHQTGKAYHPSLIVAMKLASKKMDHYYSLTDSSLIYQIAMVLHPGIKLEYFHNQKWEEEWIDEALSRKACPSQVC